MSAVNSHACYAFSRKITASFNVQCSSVLWPNSLYNLLKYFTYIYNLCNLYECVRYHNWYNWKNAQKIVCFYHIILSASSKKCESWANLPKKWEIQKLPDFDGKCCLRWREAMNMWLTRGPVDKRLNSSRRVFETFVGDRYLAHQGSCPSEYTLHFGYILESLAGIAAGICVKHILVLHVHQHSNQEGSCY